jgi:hypothetical protein
VRPGIHLELQPVLHVLLKRLSDRLVKGAKDLHGQLRVDALAFDEIVECIRQSEPDAESARLVMITLSVVGSREERRQVPAPTVQLVERLSSGRHDCARAQTPESMFAI